MPLITIEIPDTDNQAEILSEVKAVAIQNGCDYEIEMHHDFTSKAREDEYNIMMGAG